MNFKSAGAGGATVGQSYQHTCRILIYIHMYRPGSLITLIYKQVIWRACGPFSKRGQFNQHNEQWVTSLIITSPPGVINPKPPTTFVSGTVIFLVIVLLVGLAQADNFDRFCANAVDGQFVASPRSCQHWLYCQNGAATEGQCPNQYYFDEPIQMCRYPEYVNCNIGSVDFTCPSNDFQLFPHPKECGQYVACINGRAQEMDCAPGLYFDSSRNLCDLPANTDCHVEVSLDYFVSDRMSGYLINLCVSL